MHKKCPILLSLLSVFACLLLSRPAEGQFEGDPELLREAAANFKKNRDGIRTWQGEAKINRKLEGDGWPATGSSRNTATFVVDRIKDTSRWGWMVDEASASSQVLRAHQMIKDDAFYDLGPIPVGQKHPHSLYIYARRAKQAMPLSFSFDPFWYLAPAGVDVHALMSSFAEQAASPDTRSRMVPTTVRREGNKIIVENKSAMGENRYEFDADQGGNLVLYYGGTELSKSRMEWTYQEAGGVWVPRQFTYSVSNSYGGKTKALNWNVDFVKNVVNQPIDASEFTIEKMGIEPGDEIQDLRTGVVIEYRPEAAKPFGEVKDGAGNVFHLDAVNPPAQAKNSDNAATKPSPQTQASSKITSVPKRPERESESGVQTTSWMPVIGGLLTFLALLLVVVSLIRKRR